MTVLPLVLLILMILSLTVVQSSSSFLESLHGRISLFELHQQDMQQRLMRIEGEKRDQHIAKIKGAGGGTEGEVRRSGMALRTLNLWPLIDRETFEKERDRSTFTFQVAEKLIWNAFGEAPFFRAFLDEDPQIVERFFEAIRSAKEKFHKKGKLSFDDLAKMDLQEERLQRLLFELTKGESIARGDLPKVYLSSSNVSLRNSFSVQPGSLSKIRLSTATPALLEVFTGKKGADLFEFLERREQLTRLAKREGYAKLANEEWRETLLRFGVFFDDKWVTSEITPTKP